MLFPGESNYFFIETSQILLPLLICIISIFLQSQHSFKIWALLHISIETSENILQLYWLCDKLDKSWLIDKLLIVSMKLTCRKKMALESIRNTCKVKKMRTFVYINLLPHLHIETWRPLLYFVFNDGRGWLTWGKVVPAQECCWHWNRSPLFKWDHTCGIQSHF